LKVLTRISNHYRNLSPSEKRVADYVLQDYSQILMMPLQTIAQRSHTSEATVIRFCRALGFTGYQDFKSALIPEVLRSASQSDLVEPQGDFERTVKKLRSSLQEGIQGTLENLRMEDLQAVVEAMHRAHCVIIVGLAGSAGVAKVFSGTLMSLGIAASVYSDRVEIERRSLLVHPSDVLFAISHSGDTEEVCVAIERARSGGAYTVGITNFSPSRVSSLADITLLTTTREPMLGSYSCSPRIGQLALLELLSNMIMAAKTDNP